MRVYTQGSFDILHSGHINLFRKCRKLAGDGEVIVAVLSDESYKAYRGYPPAKPFKERVAVVEACEGVDRAVKSDNRKTAQEIRKFKPDLVVVGSDWASKDIYKQYHMKREEIDHLLIYNPYTVTITSTMIKERIKNEAD